MTALSLVWISGLSLAMGGLLVGQGQESESKPAKPAEPLKIAPRAYYRDHCQRCHGVDGINFLPGYAQKAPLDKLRADVRRMAVGAGEAPLEAPDIEVQTAYAELASAGKPFLSWTGKKDLVLTGEASLGSDVTAMVNGKPIKVEVDDETSNWTIILASQSDLRTLQISAKLEKQVSSFKPFERAYSVLLKVKEDKKLPNKI